MRDIISPLSDSDVKAKEDIAELDKEIKLNKEKFEGVQILLRGI